MSTTLYAKYWQTLRPLRKVGKLRGVISIPAFDVDMGPPEVSYYSQNAQWNNAAVAVALIDGTGLTLECWAKIPAGSRLQDIRLVGVNNNLLIVHSDMTVTGRFSNGAPVNATSATPAVPRGEWFHIATTCDGTIVNVYVNFVLVATTAFTGTLSTTSTNVSLANTLNGQNQVGCSINEVRVWNYARTIDQLQFAAYTNRDISGVIDVGLNAYFPFNEGTGASIANQVAAKAFSLAENPYGGGNPAWVSDDGYPYRLGASYISGWFLIDTSGKSFSLKYPVRRPSLLVNFVPCISWIEVPGEVIRYRLWTQTSLPPDSVFDVWPLIPFYNGEVIPDGAKIEIWNLDGERDVVLSEAIDIDTSILNIVSDPDTTTQTATATLATPIVSDIAATFPISFPMTFDQPQTSFP